METKSRYEVMAELETKKLSLITQRENLDNNIELQKRAIKNLERNLEDENEKLHFMLDNMDSEKEKINVQIEAIQHSIDRMQSIQSQQKK